MSTKSRRKKFVDELVRLAIERDDQRHELVITSLKTDTTLRLPIVDIPLLRALLGESEPPARVAPAVPEPEQGIEDAIFAYAMTGAADELIAERVVAMGEKSVTARLTVRGRK